MIGLGQSWGAQVVCSRRDEVLGTVALVSGITFFTGLFVGGFVMFIMTRTV